MSGGIFNFPEISRFLAFIDSHTQFFCVCCVGLIGHVSTSEHISLRYGGSERMLAQPGSSR